VTDLAGALAPPKGVKSGEKVVFDPAKVLDVEVNGVGMPW
jgi:hypothetical protein